MTEKSRIALKRITIDKLLKIMHWRMSPEVTEYMYTDPNLMLEKQKEWFERISNDASTSYWIIKFDGEDVGVVNLYDIDLNNKRCFWAYYIGERSARGKGIARHLECNIYDYVFFELGMNKLCCEVFASNDKVVDIHKKFGSEIEGVFRQHIYKRGQFMDVVRMAILKEKWEKIRSQNQYERIIIEK